jgi:hypothetical protein
MMLKIEIQKSALDNIIRPVSVFSYVAKMAIQGKKMEIYGLHESLVASITVVYRNRKFESLPNRSGWIDIERLPKMVQTMQGDTKVKLEVNTDKDDFRAYTSSVDYRTGDDNDEEIRQNSMPSQAPSVATKFQWSKITRIVQSTDFISSDIEFTIPRNECVINVTAEDKDGLISAEKTIKPETLIRPVTAEYKVFFTDDIFTSADKVIPTEATVQLWLRPDEPAILFYPLPDVLGHATIFTETKQK